MKFTNFAGSKRIDGMNLRKRQLLGFLFFFLFAIYWCGITCFTHSHVENGVVIVHSHPFTDAHHTHTGSQYETIFYLTHFFSLSSTPYAFEGMVLFALLLTPYFIRNVRVAVQGRKSVLFLRAPPIGV